MAHFYLSLEWAPLDVYMLSIFITTLQEYKGIVCLLNIPAVFMDQLSLSYSIGMTWSDSDSSFNIIKYYCEQNQQSNITISFTNFEIYIHSISSESNFPNISLSTFCI